MNNETVLVDKRLLFFKWRLELAIAKKMLLALGMAGATGLLAQIYIPLPFTPVPVTGQVLGVLLSGVICGAGYGAISQLLYFGLGLAGIPWFAGATGGIGFLLAPTTGYFIGFIIAAYVIGKYTDTHIIKDRNPFPQRWEGLPSPQRQEVAPTFFSQLGIMAGAVGIVYFFGAIVLAFVMKSGFWETIMKGVIPFILIDFAKSGVAATVGFSILPRKNAS